jgi:DsbC/DsbD-like thiol-disulfide interchange protein
MLPIFAIATTAALVVPADPDSGPKVQASIAADHTHATAGQVVWVAVQFQIAPEWHIYWPGQNDTGSPPRFKWDLPAGWKIGKARWPTPGRYTSSGEMLDHILEGSPTVSFPVLVPADAPIGSVGKLSVEIESFVCREMCLIEDHTVSVSIRVAGAPVAAHRSNTMAALGQARPKPLTADAVHIKVERSSSQVLNIETDLKGTLSFYPDATSRTVLDIAESCQTRAGVLRLSFESDMNDPISGVIHFVGDDGTIYAYEYRDPPEPQSRRDGFEIEPKALTEPTTKE